MVWYAAEQVYPGKRFLKYAILGDDIVIADKAVKDRYLDILSNLGVDISPSKSICSEKGVCEYAKRFRVDRLKIDISPISMKNISLSRTPLGWLNFIKSLPRNLRLSTKLRIAGVGFKAASRTYHSRKHGKRVKRLIVMLTWAGKGDFSLLLALHAVLGAWIPPSVVGRLYDLLLQKFAPKDLVTPPSEVYIQPESEEFVEYTLLQRWMEQYLKYLHWYAKASTRQDSLDVFLQAPVYNRFWYRVPERESDTVFRIIHWASELMKQRNEFYELESSIEKVPSETVDYCLEDHQTIRL